MKKLIIVRHGSYEIRDGDYRISDAGRKEMKILADKLRHKLDGNRIVVLSSTAPRASDSAYFLSNGLGLKVIEEHEILWSDNSHRVKMNEVMELLKAKGEESDVVIVVSHLEYSEYLPTRFAREVMGLDTRCFELPKGGAYLCDCEAKTILRL